MIDGYSESTDFNLITEKVICFFFEIIVSWTVPDPMPRS